MENRFEEITYYTLQDLAEESAGQSPILPYSEDLEALSTIVSYYGVSVPTNLVDGQSIVSDVLSLYKMIYARYWKHYCFGTDIDLTDEHPQAQEFFVKLLNIASFTYDKYKDLLGYWASLKTKLMGGIKQTTTGQIRFNDTPQDISAVSDDKFASNLTKSTQEAESSANTPVERLKEINDKIVNIYLEWTNEFDKIFIEEGNI